MRVLIATLLAAAVCAEGKPFGKSTYLVAVPQCIRPGLNANIFVDISMGLGDGSEVVVELINRTTDEVFAKSSPTMAYSGYAKVIPLLIPRDLKWTERMNYIVNESYYIRVTGNGKYVSFQNMTTVRVASQNATAFLQTDKPVYKPGQTVNYRIFSLTPDLKINKAPYKVTIWNPNRDRIVEEEDVYDATGLISGSIDLSEDPVFGIWSIQASTLGTSVYKSFEVKEYVLPRIEVTVNPPPFLVVSQETVEITIDAEYTFGEAVRGNLEVTLKKSWWWSRYRNETQPVKQLIVNNFEGSATVSLPMADVLDLFPDNQYSWQSVSIEANLTESLTGTVTSKTGRVRIYEHAEKLEFLPTNPRTFKPSLDYVAYAKITKQDGTPVDGRPGKPVFLAQYSYYEEERKSPNPKSNSDKPKDSILEVKPILPYRYYRTKNITASFVDVSVLDDDETVEIVVYRVPDKAESLNLQVTYGGQTRYFYASRAYSPSNSFIQMIIIKELLHPGQTQKVILRSNVPISSYSLLLSSRGRIVWHHEKTGDRKSALKTHGVKIPLTVDMAPRAKLTAYYKNGNGEIVADVISFNVLDPFRNKVTVGFDQPEVQPGDNVTLTVRADANSMVASLAVDKQVLLLNSFQNNDITEQQVSDSLWSFARCSYYGWWGWGRGGRGAILERRRKKRSFIPWRYPYYGSSTDAASVFAEAGLKVLTDANLYQHAYYRSDTNILAKTGGDAESAVDESSNSKLAGGLTEVGDLRTDFPETWLFQIGFTDSSGEYRIPSTAPDSITSWQATAFAFNDVSGFGIAPEPAKLTVKKAFFANIYLPYSVIRGEDVLLQVNVFNYLPIDQEVLVTLRDATSFLSLVIDSAGNQITTTGDVIRTKTVRSGRPTSVVFPVRMTELGKVPITVTVQSGDAADGLTKTLLVEAEGVPDEYNFVELVNLTSQNTFTSTRNILYPPNVVQGTKKLGVKLVGDVLGSTLENIDNLVRMSYGCGEQNMMNFAPTVYVSRYLNTVQKLTPELRKNAENFILKGYQRQLKYKRTDGSFSTWGNRDKSGNLWLTAFVAGSFATAEREGFIQVDPNVMDMAYRYISRYQLEDGSFNDTGARRSYLQGETGKGNALTAFILAAFLEYDQSVNYSTTIEKALAFVENYVDETTDLYELAIGAYALALADSPKLDGVLTKLEERATRRDGFVFWEVEGTSQYRWNNPTSRANGATIETVSYVCIAYGKRQDKEKAANCMAYLADQQNDYGGFVSTQDTVRAVQALSEIGSMFFYDNPSGTVTVTAGGQTEAFTINSENRLDLQTAEFPVSAPSVTVTGSGYGLFLVSIHAKFNVEADLVQPAFEVTTNITRDQPALMAVTICARYTAGERSRMANIDIRLPSGFTLAEGNRDELLNTVQEVETFDGRVLLYLDSITNSQVCVEVKAAGDGSVDNPKPCHVRVFNYYDPEQSALTFYQLKSQKKAWCESSTCAAIPECTEKCAARRRK